MYFGDHQWTLFQSIMRAQVLLKYEMTRARPI